MRGPESLEEYLRSYPRLCAAIVALSNGYATPEAAAYLVRHEVPEHPLRARRYLSIGCWPCTQPVEEGQGERSGRWAGSQKTECGIHTFLRTREA